LGGVSVTAVTGFDFLLSREEVVNVAIDDGAGIVVDEGSVVVGGLVVAGDHSGCGTVRNRLPASPKPPQAIPMTARAGAAPVDPVDIAYTPGIRFAVEELLCESLAMSVSVVTTTGVPGTPREDDSDTT
jgi:hypothetical protein